MIYIGADHRGFELKEKIKQWLSEWGYQYEDMGAFEYNKDDDYPDFAKAVARKVARAGGVPSILEDTPQDVTPQDAEGILICGSGIGMAIAANKIRGIRAGTASTPEQVKAAVNDEDLNILCLSADYLPDADIAAKEIIKTFLETKFSGEERHVRRVQKIRELE